MYKIFRMPVPTSSTSSLLWKERETSPKNRAIPVEKKRRCTLRNKGKTWLVGERNSSGGALSPSSHAKHVSASSLLLLLLL